jgi:hypothetical protein
MFWRLRDVCRIRQLTQWLCNFSGGWKWKHFADVKLFNGNPVTIVSNTLYIVYESQREVHSLKTLGALIAEVRKSLRVLRNDSDTVAACCVFKPRSILCRQTHNHGRQQAKEYRHMPKPDIFKTSIFKMKEIQQMLTTKLKMNFNITP